MSKNPEHKLGGRVAENRTTLCAWRYRIWLEPPWTWFGTTIRKVNYPRPAVCLTLVAALRWFFRRHTDRPSQKDPDQMDQTLVFVVVLPWFGSKSVEFESATSYRYGLTQTKKHPGDWEGRRMYMYIYIYKNINIHFILLCFTWASYVGPTQPLSPLNSRIFSQHLWLDFGELRPNIRIESTHGC